MRNLAMSLHVGIHSAGVAGCGKAAAKLAITSLARFLLGLRLPSSHSGSPCTGVAGGRDAQAFYQQSPGVPGDGHGVGARTHL